MSTKILSGVAAAMLLATTAAAQTTPARPAAAAAAPARAPVVPTNPGPVIAGICLLDGAGAIARSAAGQATNTRMNTLRQQVQAELQPQATALNAEATRIRGLPAAQQQAPAQAFEQRAQTFQQLQQTRAAELERTQVRALQRIEAELQPAVAQLYVQRGCGVMLDRGSVVYSNPAMDVTPAAITALNARLPTITFERERITATPAAPAAR